MMTDTCNHDLAELARRYDSFETEDAGEAARGSPGAEWGKVFFDRYLDLNT